MLSPASALPVGPSDWHPEVIPRAEYVGRVAAVRKILQARGVDGLLIPGSVPRHGALAYLTGHTPKLQPSFALLPVTGPIRVLYSGPPGMRPSAAAQTWVDDLRPVGHIGQQLAQWARELRPSGMFVLGLWDGEQLSAADEASIRHAIAEIGTAEELSDQLDELPRRKSAIERQIVCNAATLMAPMIDSIRDGLLAGQTIRRAVLAGERTAYALGAQDARILASTRIGGMPIAFDAVPEIAASSINIYLAVRMFGYWVEAYAATGNMTAATAQALADLEKIIGHLCRSHATTDTLGVRFRCCGIGLNLTETPRFDHRIDLKDGDVCSLVIERKSSEAVGFASAVLVAEADGVREIWRTRAPALAPVGPR